MKKFTVTLSFLLMLTFSISAQTRHILHSKHIARADTVWVFTPSGYNADAGKTYPLVYLLHGWSGSYHQWNDIMGCQQYADRYGFIIVCPDGLYDSWYLNSPVIKESQYTDFFFRDLYPFISKTYRTSPENIFIAGLSMGGHGALYLFEQQPELFRSAGSLSGVLDLKKNWKDYRIHDYLGIVSTEADSDRLSAYSVSGNIEKIAASGKEIIFTCGSSDPFYEINNEFKNSCDRLKIKATYISNPGGHDYPYWKSTIRYIFDFFSQQIKPAN